MANALKNLLLEIVAKKSNGVQLCLRGGGPLGPGVLEVHEGELFVMNVRAQIARPSRLGGPPVAQKATLPMIFSPDDVVWVSEGPLDEKGKPINMLEEEPPQRGGGIQLGG